MQQFFRVDGVFESFRTPCWLSRILEFCQVRDQTFSSSGIQDKNFEIKVYNFALLDLLFRSEQQDSLSVKLLLLPTLAKRQPTVSPAAILPVQPHLRSFSVQSLERKNPLLKRRVSLPARLAKKKRLRQ